MKFTGYNHRFWDPAVFISGFIIILILALNLNFPAGKPRMGGEIWSDKAGYYVYLPAAFIYHFDAVKFPDSIDRKTSNGFSLDPEKNKVLTKYTCGVAVLVTPFFLTAHFLAHIFNQNTNGFSMIYQWMAVMAAVFYLTLGLFFLKKLLDNYFRSWISYITLLFLLGGTNLYFYGLDDVLMSHIYSFFLLSLFLFLLKKFLDGQGKNYVHFIFLSIVATLLVLVRPTNIVLLLIVLFFDAHSVKGVGKRISLLLKPKYQITFFVIAFIIFFPQMLYWKYAYGTFVHYTYVGEGFTNWLHPRIIEIWFSPLNGLFLYNPILLFIIAGMILMIFKRIPNGIFILVFFLFISYLFSSWCIWYYGGCHGSRPFVDFYPLLCLPFGYMIDFIYYRKKMTIKIIFTVLIVFFSFFNIKLIYNYQCFMGSTWGWDDFLQTLDRAGLYNLERSTYSYKNDFENITIDNGVPTTTQNWRSGSRSTFMIEDMTYNCNYTRKVDDIIRHKIIKKANLSVWINPRFSDRTGALLVFQISDSADKPLCSKIIRANDQVTGIGKWTEIKGSFEVPEGVDPTDKFSFYIWNYGMKRFYIDDLELKFN